MTQYLPIFLDLQAKPVVLIGGGTVAYEKLVKLVQAGAKVKVIALDFYAETMELIRASSFEWEQRPYQPQDLDGQFLVLSAVNHEEVHAEIAALARARGILINAVDAPASSDFYFAAQVQRGPLQIAISTQGLFPGVARSLRLWLEEILPPEITPEFEDLVAIRKAVKVRIPDQVGRMKALKEQLLIWNLQTSNQFLENRYE